jgi:hypothetical protein
LAEFKDRTSTIVENSATLANPIFVYFRQADNIHIVGVWRGGRL